MEHIRQTDEKWLQSDPVQPSSPQHGCLNLTFAFVVAIAMAMISLVDWLLIALAHSVLNPYISLWLLFSYGYGIVYFVTIYGVVGLFFYPIVITLLTINLYLKIVLGKNPFSYILWGTILVSISFYVTPWLLFPDFPYFSIPRQTYPALYLVYLLVAGANLAYSIPRDWREVRKLNSRKSNSSTGR